MRKRDRLLLEIVARYPVKTQSGLVTALRRAGVMVTQATVSRDIRRLGLIKVPTGAGSYRYQAPASVRPPAGDAGARLRRAFADYLVNVEEGSGLVLVKTTFGSAGAVAEAIDVAAWPEVAGTVAGDNTILVVPRRPAQRAVLLRRLRALA